MVSTVLEAIARESLPTFRLQIGLQIMNYRQLLGFSRQWETQPRD